MEGSLYRGLDRSMSKESFSSDYFVRSTQASSLSGRCRPSHIRRYMDCHSVSGSS